MLNDREKIQILLTEYQALRQSLTHFFNVQITVFTIVIGFLGAVLLSGLKLLSASPSATDAAPSGSLDPLSAMLFFCIIIPGLSSFLSIIWFDHAFRQVETGAYLSLIEGKINKIVQFGEPQENVLNAPLPLMHWEHWNKEQFRGQNFFGRTNQYYYYVCCGMFIMLPLSSFCMWYFGTSPTNTKHIIIGSSVFLVICFALSFFAYKYIKRIIYYDKFIADSPL